MIDGTGTPPSGAVDLVIRGDRIAAIVGAGSRSDQRGPTDESETVIPGRGLTALPGLIDAHAHYTFDPTEGSLQTIARRTDEEILTRAAAHAELALRAGVTTSRGAGSIRGLEMALRDEIAAGRLEGPRIVAAGTAVGAVDGHGVAFGLEATGPDAMRRATEQVIAAGADVVKLVASEAAMLTTTGHAPGRIVFGRPEVSVEEVAAVVDTAARHGRRVMAHAQDSESVVRCARGGVASVEHAWLADEGAIREVGAAGCALVPTLVVTDVNRTLGGLTRPQRERQNLIESTHGRSLTTAIALGVPMATGTDTGEVGVTADLVWREIGLLVAHGLTPLAAIASATSVAARLLGLDEEIGSIAVGKRADLIVVAGDPLADLGRLVAPRHVVQAGRLLPGATLDGSDVSAPS